MPWHKHGSALDGQKQCAGALAIGLFYQPAITVIVANDFGGEVLRSIIIAHA
jgi:hypothetical protein